MTLQQAIRTLERMSVAGDRPDNAQFEYIVYLLWALYERDEASIKFALADLAGVLSEERKDAI